MTKSIKISLAVAALVGIGISILVFRPGRVCQFEAQDCGKKQLCQLGDDKKFRCQKEGKPLRTVLKVPLDSQHIVCLAPTADSDYGHYRVDNFFRLVLGLNPESAPQLEKYPIYAPADGMVRVIDLKPKKQGDLPRRFIKLLINKGEMVSIGEFADFAVKDGDKVQAKQLLGHNAVGAVTLSAHRPPSKMRIIQDDLYLGTSVNFRLDWKGSEILASELQCGN